jgi:hypothetical protein
MTQLTLHVVNKLDIYGPIHIMWIYSIESTMKTFKMYVCNKVKFKTFMVTRYIYDETIGFVIKYMEEFKHVRFQIWDENEKKSLQ